MSKIIYIGLKQVRNVFKLYFVWHHFVLQEQKPIYYIKPAALLHILAFMILVATHKHALLPFTYYQSVLEKVTVAAAKVI